MISPGTVAAARWHVRPEGLLAGSEESPDLVKLQLKVFALLFGLVAFLPAYPGLRYVFGRRWEPLVVLLLVVLLGSVLLRRDSRRRLSPRGDWPVLLLAAALGAGVVHSSSPTDAWRTYWHLGLALIVSYFAAKIVANDPDSRSGMAVIVATVSGVVATFGIIESIFAYNYLHEVWLPNRYYDLYVQQRRPVSTQINPAALGTFLLLSWPFAAYVAARAANRVGRALGYWSSVVCVVCLFLTYSRGAFLGLIGTISVALAAGRRFKYLALAIAAVLAIVTTLSFLPYPASKYGWHQIASASRWRPVPEAVKMFLEHPLAGGGYQEYKREYGVTPDNTYLSLLSETGLLGTVAFVVLVAVLLRRATAAYRSSKGDRRAFAGAAILSLVGLLINALGYSLIYWTGPWLYACLVLGILAAVGEDSMESHSPSGRVPSASSSADALVPQKFDQT